MLCWARLKGPKTKNVLIYGVRPKRGSRKPNTLIYWGEPSSGCPDRTINKTYVNARIRPSLYDIYALRIDRMKIENFIAHGVYTMYNICIMYIVYIYKL